MSLSQPHHGNIVDAAKYCISDHLQITVRAQAVLHAHGTPLVLLRLVYVCAASMTGRAGSLNYKALLAGDFQI